MRSARELERLLRNERLTVLALELRPHFLLNALHAAAELVHDDAAAADQLLSSLGHLLAHSLRDSREHEVTLSRELELLEHYVDVERARFGDAVDVRVTVASETAGALVPPLLLQPLVENAIHHGLAPRGGQGTIRVIARRNAGMLQIDVIDDGVGFRDDVRRSAGGIGLTNVRMRLRELYGARQSVCITSQPGSGTQVTVRLPCRGGGTAIDSGTCAHAPGELDATRPHA